MPDGNQQPPRFAVIFDMDGVLADTAVLHCQSWIDVARELGRSFTAADYEPMRGLGRDASLRRFLGSDFCETPMTERERIKARKQARFEELVMALGEKDRLPGVTRLIDALRALAIPLAVASSSRNVQLVLEKLALADSFAAIVSANDVTNLKPAPDLFLEAARRIRVSPEECVVVEDAESGVAAGLAAGMRVIGVGPPARVGAAHRVVDSLESLAPAEIASLFVDPRNL
ncbi:MAG: HAD family hydrolase [Phycisphaerae bacterium]